MPNSQSVYKPNEPIGERVARVETLLHTMLKTFNDRFDSIEQGFNQKFAQIKQEQDCIKSDINLLKDAEGERLKYLKNKTVEYIVMAILGIIIGALGKAFIGGA